MPSHGEKDIGNTATDKNTAQEIADGVDAAFKPEYQSGILGFEKPLHFALPHQASTTTTGGGSVTAKKWGTHVEPGGTAGDEAHLEVGGIVTDGDVSKAITQVCLRVDAATPFTDDYQIGNVEASAGIDKNASAFLDMETAEYKVIGGGGTTYSAAATLPSNKSLMLLTIETDFVNGETVFTQEGKVNESVTISQTESQGNRPGVVVSQSNGNADGTRVAWVRRWLVP